MNDDYEQIGQHYNNLIWVVFGGAIALTTYILFQIWTNPPFINNLLIKYLALLFGYSVLFYATSVIESFGQKKNWANKKTGLEIKTPMTGKLEYLEIPPLSLIFLFYIITSIYISFNYFKEPTLFSGSLIIPILMIFGFVYVISHWKRRDTPTTFKNIFNL